ncbi:hypothetical protein LB505_013641 [Fusarium chuoi]|nr:hypothetical protein LB505_013641 [Fusarium chuoi]
MAYMTPSIGKSPNTRIRRLWRKMSIQQATNSKVAARVRGNPSAGKTSCGKLPSSEAKPETLQHTRLAG